MVVVADAPRCMLRHQPIRSARLTNLTNSISFRSVTYGKHGMSKPVNIYDAKTRLSELVDRAENGEEIIIAKAGRPVARLVPLRAVQATRAPGRWRGRVTIPRDFDAPLPEIQSAFEGDDED